MSRTEQPAEALPRDHLTWRFVREHGRECAHITFARWQRIYYSAVAVAILLLFLYRWDLCILMLTTLASGWYLAAACFKGVAALRSLRGRGVEHVTSRELEALADEQLPVYTILVPLYHEANIADRIVRSIERIDYPAAKLDVKLLLEADDQETLKAVEGCQLPPCCEVIIVPDGQPRTKPRACNYGLEAARGDFCVIYDAEDRPDPDQLRKAVVAFSRLPAKVACLQAALNYFNHDQNWLTRWFTVEYSTTFDLYLPGIQTMGAPVPLGGTSNHFRTGVLKQIGGWDPFNVTEDCDVGVRIYKRGYITRMLDSTTWEEANSKPWNWIRQRSRWVKGHLQTHLVHMRHPFATARQLGVRGTLGFFLSVGAGSFMMLVNVLYWVLGLLYLGLLWHGHHSGQSLWGMIHGPHEIGLYRGVAIGGFHLKAWPLVYSGIGESPGWVAISVSLFIVSMVLLSANLFFVLIHVLACVRRRHYRLIPMALLMPAYWVMISIGAWKGALQLLTRPSFWEKTIHGLDGTPRTGFAPARKLRVPAWLKRFVGIAFFMLLATALPAREAGWYAGSDSYQRIEPANADKATTEIPGGGLVFLQHDSHTFRASRAVFDADRMVFDVTLLSAPANVRIFAQDRDGLWFQSRQAWPLQVGKPATLAVPLSRFEHAFEPSGHAAQWHAGHASDMIVAGIRVETAEGTSGPFRVSCSAPRFEGKRSHSTLQVAHWRVPSDVPQRRMSESRFDLTREYFNPFDPTEIRVDVEIMDPNGKRSIHPAFFGVDCRRALIADLERVTPVGMPYWAYRFTPEIPGLHQHRLLVTDASGGKVEQVTTPWRTCNVLPGDAPGFVKVDPGHPLHFAFESGEVFFPVGMNLHSINDPRGSRVLGEGMLPDYGTYSFDEYLVRMSRAGISATEIWMAAWSMGLEWSADRRGYRGLGRYNMLNAWCLDHLISEADRLGIRIQLTLDNHGKFSVRDDPEWLESPFNALAPFAGADGAFLYAAPDFFTDKRAMALTHQRNRYIAARWGQSPTIFGVELWSELDLVADCANLYRSGTLADWTTNVVAQLRAEGLRQLITTHVSGNYKNNLKFLELHQLPQIDYVAGDAYRDRGISMIEQLKLQDAGLGDFNKPRLITEYGGAWDGASHAELEADLHAGLWGSLFTRQAGTPMLWWHAFVHYQCGYEHYRVFADFMKGIDPRLPSFSFDTPRMEDGPRCQAFAAGTPTERYLWVANEADMTRFPSRGQRNATTTANASVELPNLAPGRFMVQWWNPLDGSKSEEEVSVSKDGVLKLRLPPFSTDIAAKIIALGQQRGPQ